MAGSGTKTGWNDKAGPGGISAARGKEGSMGKLLDRDVLIYHLRRMMEARQIDRLPKSGYAKAIEDVAGCPTVDAVPVVHGRWIYHDDDYYPWLECAECHWEYSGLKRYRYCPECGARMDSDDNAERR